MTSTRGRETAKAAGWLVAGAIGATALTGVAFAANQDSTPSPSGSVPSTSAPDATTPDGNALQAPDGMMGGPGGMRGGPDGDGDGPGMRGGPGRMEGLGGRILHGDVTIKDDNDEAVQARIQSGTVESVSATSIVVKSEDGYTATWTVTSDTKVHRDRSDATIADVKTGDFVRLQGPLSGDTATAKNLRALSPEAKAALDKMKAARDAARGTTTSDDQGSNSSSSASSGTNV